MEDSPSRRNISAVLITTKQCKKRTFPEIYRKCHRNWNYLIYLLYIKKRDNNWVDYYLNISITSSEGRIYAGFKEDHMLTFTQITKKKLAYNQEGLIIPLIKL